MTDSMSDRLPPQDLSAEQVTLGAMLMDPGAVERARMILIGPEDFYREAHRQVYAAIETVDDAGDPVDVTTVGAVLRRREQLAAIGGGEYLTRLIGEVPTTAHIIRYATIVREAAHRRNLIVTASEVQGLAYDGELPVEELEVQASDRLRRWADVSTQEGEATRFVGQDGYGPKLQEALVGEPANSYTRTGVGALDRAMGTMAGHSTVIVVADTKTGKSIMAQQCALTTARLLREHEPGAHVLAFILEAYSIWRRRAVGWLGGFDSMVFRRGDANLETMQRWRQAEEELEGLPLLVNHSHRNIMDIIRTAREVVDDRHKFADVERLGLIIVDHAQRLSGPGDKISKYDNIGLELEVLSNELNCPVLMPSQATQKEGYRSTKWATSLLENASIIIEMTRGLEDDPPAQRMVRNFGTFACNFSRLNSFGTIPYYVDVGGRDQVNYRRDLRMYDTNEWRAQGWRTKEQQLEWEENQRLAAAAKKRASEAGARRGD